MVIETCTTTDRLIRFDILKQREWLKITKFRIFKDICHVGNTIDSFLFLRIVKYDLLQENEFAFVHTPNIRCHYSRSIHTATNYMSCILY